MDNIEEAMVGWYEKAKTLETSNAALREENDLLWRCLVKIRLRSAFTDWQRDDPSGFERFEAAMESHNLPALMKALGVDNG